jgi:UDP-glucuronate 4-epimerase
MAVWLFTEAMAAGRAIKVFNQGRMRRDFTYIDDIVSGVKAALSRDNLASYEVLNLGNHQAENLLDMIAVLAESLGVEPRTELLPMQPGDVEATYADIALARAKLGFEPATSIRQGIPRFVKWYREYYRL